MSTEQASIWKILPKHFFNWININKYFSSNYRIISKKEIPLLYKEIYAQFMKHFKQGATNMPDFLNQSIWYNTVAVTPVVKCQLSGTPFQNTFKSIGNV